MKVEELGHFCPQVQKLNQDVADVKSRESRTSSRGAVKRMAA